MKDFNTYKTLNTYNFERFPFIHTDNQQFYTFGQKQHD